MNLIIDIGNTLTKCIIIHNDDIINSITVEVLSPHFLTNLLQQYPQLSNAILCSVRREELTDIVDFLSTKLKTVINFNHRTPIPLRNLYGTPETLGYDRMAAAIGAWHFFPRRDLMVIDCGTAITIDFISCNGEYLGGNISPGINTRFKALNVFTGKLPLGKINPDAPIIGKNTQEAIEAGVLNGIIAEIDSYINNNLNHTIILTGGDAIFFAKKLKNPIFVICNLVSLGLNRVLKYNIAPKQWQKNQTN